jgi:hypothetical protein
MIFLAGGADPAGIHYNVKEPGIYKPNTTARRHIVWISLEKKYLLRH